MRFQRWGISWSLFVVSLTTVWFSRRNSNSLWSWFDAHNQLIFVVQQYLLPFVTERNSAILLQKDRCKLPLYPSIEFLSITDCRWHYNRIRQITCQFNRLSKLVIRKTEYRVIISPTEIIIMSYSTSSPIKANRIKVPAFYIHI